MNKEQFMEMFKGRFASGFTKFCLKFVEAKAYPQRTEDANTVVNVYVKTLPWGNYMVGMKKENRLKVV